MLKNFLRLFFILGFVAILVIIIIQILINFLMSGNLSDDFKNSPFNAPLFLIKRNLNNKPQSEWPTVIKELQKHYSYPLELKNINELNFTEIQKKSLHENTVMTIEHNLFSDDENIWYSLIDNSDFVILLSMSEPNDIAIDNSNKGIFYSFIKYMDEVPKAEWQKQFDLFKQYYGIEVKLHKIDKLNFTNKQIIKLDQEKIIEVDTDLFSFILYKKIIGTNYVLQLTPFSNSSTNNFLIDNYQFVLPLTLAIILATILYLWMRPIWRDLNILKTVTTSFGHGNFKIRSDLSKKSAIWNLSETFNSMAARISKLITSHKDLTNAVSHELRTPLSRMRFAIEMLNEETDKELKQEFIDSMSTDIVELEILVSELLTYARFDRENPDLKYSELNISQWLINLVNKLQSENTDINLQFINLTSEQTQLVYFDPKLIDRALNNLIRNAIRYTKNRVDICLSFKNNFCCITIDDDGPGIPENERERILEPFTRIDFSRNRKTGGYGLGLSIVQQIVKWHEGNITITKSRYNGASFELCLPNVLN